MKIQDGRGSGQMAKVDGEGHLHTRTVEVTAEHAANHVDGNAYHWGFTVSPSAAGDIFAYIKNTDDKDLVLEGFICKLAADDYILIKKDMTGTPAGSGSDDDPTNMNLGINNEADGTFHKGPDITGLSGGTEMFRHYHASSAEDCHINFDTDIIVPKNSVVTFQIGTGGVQLYFGLNMYYSNPDWAI